MNPYPSGGISAERYCGGELHIIFLFMIFKRLFDIIASFCGLLLIWWIFPIVAFLIHKKMPGSPTFSAKREWERMAGCLLVINSAR